MEKSIWVQGTLNIEIKDFSIILKTKGGEIFKTSVEEIVEICLKELLKTEDEEKDRAQISYRNTFQVLFDAYRNIILEELDKIKSDEEKLKLLEKRLQELKRQHEWAVFNLIHIERKERFLKGLIKRFAERGKEVGEHVEND